MWCFGAAIENTKQDTHTQNKYTCTVSAMNEQRMAEQQIVSSLNNVRMVNDECGINVALFARQSERIETICTKKSDFNSHKLHYVHIEEQENRNELNKRIETVE